MKKQIVGIILGIILISLTSALTYNITAGESILFMIPEPFDYYSIVGNQSEVDLNITQEGLNITITLDKYSQSDSFEIIFFNAEKEIIIEHHYSSGGTKKVYVEKETIVEVDNYIVNETEIQRLDDELQKTKDELNKKDKRINFLLFTSSIFLCFFLFLLLYTLRKNINKMMSGLKIFKKN